MYLELIDYLNASALAIGYFMLSIPALLFVWWWHKSIYDLIYEAFVPIRNRKRIKERMVSPMG